MFQFIRHEKSMNMDLVKYQYTLSLPKNTIPNTSHSRVAFVLLLLFLLHLNCKCVVFPGGDYTWSGCTVKVLDRSCVPADFAVMKGKEIGIDLWRRSRV